jgi:hypothetical protein
MKVSKCIFLDIQTRRQIILDSMLAGQMVHCHYPLFYCSLDQEAEVPKILHNLSRNLDPLKVRHTLELRDTVSAMHNACPCGLAGRFKQDCTESPRTQTAGTLSTVTMTYEL